MPAAAGVCLRKELCPQSSVVPVFVLETGPSLYPVAQISGSETPKGDYRVSLHLVVIKVFLSYFTLFLVELNLNYFLTISHMYTFHTDHLPLSPASHHCPTPSLPQNLSLSSSHLLVLFREPGGLIRAVSSVWLWARAIHRSLVGCEEGSELETRIPALLESLNSQ